MGIFNFFKKKKNNEEIINEEKQDISTSEEESENIETEDVLTDAENIDAEEISEEVETYGEEVSETDNIDEATVDETAIIEEIEETEEILEKDTEYEKAIETSEEETEEEKQVEDEKEKKGFFSKMFESLDKTRKNILGNIESVLKSFTKLDDEFYEELEDALISADIGVSTSLELVEKLREKAKEEKINEPSKMKDLLINEITSMLTKDFNQLELPSPSVILVAGVNGVGKTTTIGKLASIYSKEGKKVILAAADTFRAAAIEQLQVWGERSDVPVIAHKQNSDPGAVVFDAIQAAKSRKSDLLICDTAGRLHNKKNLMEELKKIYRIIEKEHPDAKLETFITLDATTGQNALAQAKTFKEICNVTGIVLTKLDGTAKGGIILPIVNELNIPVRYIGIGEGIDDLRPFDPHDFANALFSNEK